MSTALSNPIAEHPPAPEIPTDAIVVRGARTHNLKNIDFEIPHNALTVVTGVSGSGKSSLAFDTIYAEGQRRYVESLSAYARQFLERIEKPDADHIEGIAPAVAIRQKNTTRNPRSTVGTATEIYDYLRLLFARVGRTYCVRCGAEVKKDTVDEVADAVLALEHGTRLNVLFPVSLPSRVVARPDGGEQTTAAGSAGLKRLALTSLRRKTRKKSESEKQTPTAEALKARLFELRQRGFNRLFQRGQVFEFSTPESLLEIDFAEALYVLADRLAVSSESRARIVDATEIAFRESDEVIFEEPGAAGVARQLRFSQRFECKRCGTAYVEPEPRLFSFNNPYGACPKCQGFGNTIDFDLDLVIPNKSKSLNDGAVEPWTKPKYRPWATEMKRHAKQAGIPLDVPWSELDPEQQRKIVDGEKKFPGVRGFFKYLERKKYKVHVRVFLSRYRGYTRCTECNGNRLRVEAQQVKIAGRNICEVCAMTVEHAARFFQAVELTEQESGIADRLLHEIRSRLMFLNDVGLEYLNLDRLTSTLSGGEAQRIQLATSLGSQLVGTLYVLDEPSIGLHSRDTHRLIKILHGLRELGNTVLVVEHDPDVMRASDRVLDLGPGAGEHGGRIIATGTYEQIMRNPASLTGRYLAQDLRIQLPTSRRKPGRQRLKVYGAHAHNLKNIDVMIPLGMLVAITGVSGSGKSTFVHDVLYPNLNKSKTQTPPFEGQIGLGNAEEKNNGSPSLQALKGLEGAEFIDEIILVDQSPIGRTPRSNPVTYIKAFDGIRELFASTPEANKRGFAAGHFSFNVPGGRCETCQGDGTVVVEMQFLADVELVCEECEGKRFKPEVLEVRYRGKNIHDVLEMTVREAMHHFAGAPKVADKLRLLEEVGLGYLRLGQSATTLSGGEAQRVKLAAHLQGTRNGKPGPNGERSANRSLGTRLYILDEPTTGLHFDDISKLLSTLRRLIEAGGSVLVIEHNLEVIKTADWVIDLGPEGGDRGGYIVGEGPPEEIVKIAGSYTGQYLAGVLNANGASRN